MQSRISFDFNFVHTASAIATATSDGTPSWTRMCVHTCWNEPKEYCLKCSTTNLDKRGVNILSVPLLVAKTQVFNWVFRVFWNFVSETMPVSIRLRSAVWSFIGMCSISSTNRWRGLFSNRYSIIPDFVLWL